MSQKNEDEQDSSTVFGVLAAIILIGFAALPVAILMFPLSALARRKKAVVGVAALAGVGLFWVLCLTPIKAEYTDMQEDLKAKRWSHVFEHAPDFWLLTLPFAPLAGMGWDLFRPRSAAEKVDEEERTTAERAENRERKGWRTAIKEQERVIGVPVATIKHMPRTLPDFTRKNHGVYLNVDVSTANLHSLILGGSGAGKTETIKRLAYIFAVSTDYDIFLIDPKPTKRLKLAFAGIMGSCGRVCHMYPEQPFNGFRGNARALHNRFLTIPKLGTDGASAYYAELTEEYLWLGIKAGRDVPTSFAELVQRLDYDFLTAYYQDDPVSLQSMQRIKRADANSITMRFSNIARKLDGFSADGWAFEDVRAGYFGLPVLESTRDVNAVARYLIEDLKHYFGARKGERRTVVIIDEFSALGSENVVNLMELVRDLGGIVILASQTTAALGDERLQKRILGNVTTYLQRMNDARDVAALGGIMQKVDVSVRYGDADANERGTKRYVDQAVIDPTRVAQLPTGAAYLINRGYVAQVQMMQAPPVDWSTVNPATLMLCAEIEGTGRSNAPILRKRAPDGEDAASYQRATLGASFTPVPEPRGAPQPTERPPPTLDDEDFI